jgi:thioester reductase-like protein
MGIGATAVIPVLYDSTVVLGPVDKPLSGELAFQMMKQPGMRAILCPPSILEEMLLEPECLETASRLDFIMNAGGPLATYAGDTLSKAVDLYQLMGSTEAGTQPHLVPRRGDWRYFEWHPIYECKMDPVEEGVYELVVPRKPDLEWIQGPFQTFPEIMEWRTRDLFKQHPTRPNLWQFYGRSDDTIVLSNGEKFNPVEMESEILGHPAISGALVAGQGRMQTALILEPQDDTADREALANEIWPLVQTANSHAPAHARVFRSRIIIAPPGKRFVRAPKGTMIRRQTENLFTPEIDALDSDGSIATPSEVPASDSQHGPIEFIRRSVAACLGRDSVGDDEDILVGGIDSIQTMELAKTLRAGLKAYGEGLQLPPVTSKMIYTNPTVRGLSTWVGSYLHPGMTSKDERGGEEAKRVARMEALVKKYTDDLPRRTLRSKKRGSDRLTVVLTGSTGSLGTYILQALLKDPAVEKIYGLNRAANARERHQKDFTARGEDHDFSSPQAEFLMANFDDPHFGLSGEKYGEVLARTDVVIHNAWKVNFNHSLESFEATHIRGVRHFIDLALASDRDPHLFFVSSIGTVGNWTVHHSGEPTPETHVDDYRIAKALGYGESKFVAERILAIAAERSGVLSSILRSGQIAGPVASDRGQWNLAEWLPSLIKTSKSLGRVPDTIGYFTDVDWIPVDVLSQIVLDLVHSDYSSREGHVFNLVNPQTVKWTTLVPTVQRHLGVEPVSFAAWIDLLRKSDAQDPTELEAKPALKILDWFVDAEQVGAAPQLLQTFETRNGVALSPTMADLTAVTPEMMQTWLNQWKY